MFEVDEKGELEAGEVEVALHLGEVCVVECLHDLGINDDFAVHDEVGNAFADFGFTIDHRELFLLLDLVALGFELQFEGVFIEFLVQAGFEGVEDGHGTADDRTAQLLVDKSIRPCYFFREIIEIVSVHGMIGKKFDRGLRG